jgi:hypothetical protein
MEGMYVRVQILATGQAIIKITTNLKNSKF